MRSELPWGQCTTLNPMRSGHPVGEEEITSQFMWAISAPRISPPPGGMPWLGCSLDQNRQSNKSEPTWRSARLVSQRRTKEFSRVLQDSKNYFMGSLRHARQMIHKFPLALEQFFTLTEVIARRLPVAHQRISCVVIVSHGTR